MPRHDPASAKGLYVVELGIGDMLAMGDHKAMRHQLIPTAGYSGNGLLGPAAETTKSRRRIPPTGRKGRYGRALLATLILSDGREAGAVLVSEGLAKLYRSYGYTNFCQ